MENIEKKTYETPAAEKMEFNYRDQVVVASNGGSCQSVWVNVGAGSCTDGNAHWESLN